ncbi:MAG: DUF4340 domain-containing protein [Polyangiaceae bacterium]
MRTPRAVLVNSGILLLAVASMIAVVVTHGGVTTGEKEAQGQDLLPAFHADDVKALELEGAGQKLGIERNETPDGGSASFALVSPVKEPADDTAMNKFLSALSNAHALRPVASGSPVSTFGLDQPRLRITAKTDKRTYHLLVGGNAPTPEGACYVQVANADEAPKTVVVDKSVAQDLAVDLDAFRQRGIVSLSQPDVTRITIASPKLNLVLKRSTGTSFLIDGEPKTLADRELVSSLFFQVSRLTANRFLSAGDAEAALGPDRAHFEFETKASKQRVRFEAGGTCPGDPAQLVVVRRSPGTQSACAARELEATLRHSADDFIDRHPFSLHADEVEELDISGKNKFILLRKGNAFVLHGSSETPVELEAGNQRIASLLDVTGESVLGQKPSDLGLDPAQNTVTLRSSAARDADVVQQVVRVGNTDSAGNLWLYREQDSAVLRVPREVARFFASDSTLLYAKKLTEFGLSSFVSAEILHAAHRQVLRRDAKQNLQLEEPKGFDPDGVLSSDLIQALGSLAATRFVADRDDGSFGLDKPSTTVRFVSKSESNPKLEHVLRFGRRTELGAFATMDENGPVFVLPRSVEETCDTLLLNRAVYPNASDALKSFSLEAPQKHTLQLDRRGERFWPVPAGSFPDDELGELLEAISNLRPEAAVHVGPPLPDEGMSAPVLTLQLVPTAGAPLTLTFGAGDSWRSTSVFYLRVSGVNATFVIAQAKVRALSDALN